MASVRKFKKSMNQLFDEINYDIELYVGSNLDKSHFDAIDLYERLYVSKLKYSEKINQKLDKLSYKKIWNSLVHEIDDFNKELCEIISKS